MQEKNTSESLFISVVIPVLNEEKHIGALLESLLRQSYPADRFEILVVDGGSIDNTVPFVTDLCEKYSNLLLLRNPGRLSSSGRNVGARAARGDIVLFVDGHCEIPNEFMLRNLADLFNRTSCDIVCRPQPMEASGISTLQRAVAVARASWLGHNPSSLIFSVRQEGFANPDSSGAAYTRRVFREIGYFDEGFDACEDVDFNVRCRKGRLTAFTSPSVMIHYYPRESLGSLFRQMSRYGAGRSQLLAKHRGWALSGALLLGGGGLLIAALVPLSFFMSGPRLVLAILAGAYLVAVTVTSVVLSSQRKLSLPLSIFGALVTIHLGLSVGFWKGLPRALLRRW